MGCASSTPLVESGKNLVEAAKETANDVVNKGEKTLNEVGESVSDGVEHMKDTMQSAFNTAESNVTNVIGKIGQQISLTTNNAKEAVNEMETVKDELADNAHEAISEAETILASEAEAAKETMETAKEEMFKKADSFSEEVSKEANEMKEKVEEVMDLEDVEQHFDMLGDSVINVEDKVQEVLKGSPPASPVKEAKEEAPPTFWEAAADAIILRRMSSRLTNFQVSNLSYPEETLLVTLDIEKATEEEQQESDKDLIKSELIEY